MESRTEIDSPANTLIECAPVSDTWASYTIAFFDRSRHRAGGVACADRDPHAAVREVADLKNTPSTRYGGAITAGLFLRAFIENGTPWIHLDIAGPAFLESEQGYMRKGATGATVRTLLTFIQSLSPSS